MDMQLIPKRLYYRIGDVCRIIGVEPHVLRYWETEFPGLAPKKNKAGQRTYQPRDIEIIVTIRRLLYEEGYTIAGARKQLARAVRAEDGTTDLPTGGSAAAKKPRPAPAAPAQRLNQVREELENILTLLERE
jgi:DNA-binding transcriptional MerR regulator